MGSDTDLPRRKTIRHFDRPLQPRLLTFSCAQRRPLLLDDTHRSIVCEAIHRAALRHRVVTLAWVLMPEHVHLLCLPWHGASEISALLKAIKRPSSYRIKQHLEQTNEALAQSLTVKTQPGTSFRFWQSGPGHDRNIRSQTGLIDAIAYVHNNPVRRQLVATPIEWRWSSARQWARQEDVTPLLPVVLWYPTRGLDWDGPKAWFGTEHHE
ncbi:MAG: transposase [Phycisphaerales bacterium JB054]